MNIYYSCSSLLVQPVLRFLWLVLPGPGSGGFRPTIQWELIPGPLTMSCWPRAVLGCAQDEGFVMLDAVCKLMKTSGFLFFVKQSWRWLVARVPRNTQSLLLCSQGATGALVDLTAFLLSLCPPSSKMTSTETCILTCGQKCMEQRGGIWMVNPSNPERRSFLKGSERLPHFFTLLTNSPSLPPSAPSRGVSGSVPRVCYFRGWSFSQNTFPLLLSLLA